MAIGVVTPVAVEPRSQQGGVPVAIGDITLTVTNVGGAASYTTGGDTITAQQLGLTTLFAGQAEVQASTGSNATSTALSVVVQPGGASAKLQAWTNANVEIGNAVNVSGVTWQIIAFGTK